MIAQNTQDQVNLTDRIEDQARQAWALSEFLLAYHNDTADGARCAMSNEIVSGLLENLCERLETIREITAQEAA
ncbi:hypothetical protein [Vreelandella massiliensis]|uniref:hypothetical protein n=1 Tax=Vreelandella massiliensis TaxID=1816686 RepID=UPI00096AAA1E|nr:hypothetical protein [Halomonas massiliensis]